MVESIMSSPPICVKAMDSVAEVIDLMAENRISSVVVERDGIPEGIVMKRDILEYYLKLQERRSLQSSLFCKMSSSKISIEKTFLGT